MPKYILHTGDCIEILKKYQDNHFPAVVTDPPYFLTNKSSFDLTSILSSATKKKNVKGFMNRMQDGGTLEVIVESEVPSQLIPNKVKEKTENLFCHPYQWIKVNGHYIKPENWEEILLALAANIEIPPPRYSQKINVYYEFSKLWAEELMRVMKPGAYLLAFSSPRTWHRMACALEDSGFIMRDNLSRFYLHGMGFPKSHNIAKAMIKAGEDELAKLWEGYGTALKPAYEIILCVQKPTEGTYVDNIKNYGCGGLNINACRIPLNANEGNAECGRFPANVVLEHSESCTGIQCEDECAVNILNSQKGKLKSGKPGKKWGGNTGTAYGKESRKPGSPMHGYGDEGYASRFFYTSKASRKDRGDFNKHETVKPTDLMRWLVRMVKPPKNECILDLFMGSGSTGKACMLEGINFVGIEKEDNYVEWAERRIQDALEEFETSQEAITIANKAKNLFE